ncbi:YggS family pyridoxal phosphate-dependent enzyme [Beggiatoa alba]|nr:YggS family pyridoxal phosphate-dependent enzyme [Beggiatoa alba]
MTNLPQRLKNVQARIITAAKANNRDPDEILLLAVSKTQSVETVKTAALAGQIRFGENYLQDALPKIQILSEQGFNLEWHYIGPIQSNKTRAIAEHFQWVHSVDRLKIAQRLNQQRPDYLAPLKICIQVNIGNETQKAGVAAQELNTLAAAILQLPRLELHGLMAIPPAGSAKQQRSFATLRQLFKNLPPGPSLDTLSMGMSDDLEAAIAEGTTMLRIGTAIFGKRT